MLQGRIRDKLSSVMKKILVLGASNNPDRISNQAVKRLIESGYEVLPVHPKENQIEGLKTFSSLKQVSDSVDTISVYVNPSILKSLIEDIRKLQPRRIIFNPGSESPEAEKIFRENGIETENACTLVLLRTKQF
jgi:predicted CoA-binding protein